MTITAIDSASNTDTQSATIEINAVNDAPVTTVSLATVFLESSTLLTVDADTIDVENDTITYSLAGVDASLFSVDSDGVISFLLPPSFDSPLDNGGDNIYNLIITASDGDLSDSATLTIMIDQDSDADGVPNSIEITDDTDAYNGTDYKDSDVDGVPDYLDDDGTIDDDSGNGLKNYFIDYPTSFQCSGDYFISQNDALFQLDTSETPFVFNDVSPSGYTGKIRMNAVGFNYQDGFIYGIKRGRTNLLRIESSGHVRNMGEISGLPRKNYLRGDFDLEGNFYILRGRLFYTINLETLVAERVKLNGRFRPTDFAFNVRDGKIYGVDRSRLYTLDLSTLVVTSKTVDGLPSARHGAAWFDSAGRLFFIADQTGDIYRIDDFVNPVANYVSKGEKTKKSDGTACATAPILEHRISPALTTGSTTVTHSYTIDNGLLSGDALGDPLSVGFDDELNDGRVFVDGTLSIVGALNNPLTNNYGGTSTIDIDGLQLDPSSTVTITVDVTIPEGLGGIYYNQAKLTSAASYLGGPDILSDNPEGARPDMTPLIVKSPDNDNAFSGSVYNDLNKNGSRDNGEPTVPGVVINLKSNDGSVVSVITDINGNYIFEALTDNSYVATMILPTGSDLIGTNPLNAVSVSDGLTVSNNDFFIYNKGAISGFVFNDVDGNERIGDTENGIGGVTIELFDNVGILQGSTVTDSEGEYIFSDLDGGLYWLKETDNTNYTSVSANDVVVNVVSGQEVEQHFSDIVAGTISGVVFNDINGNGIQDDTEEPLSGVEINCYDGSTLVCSAKTDNDGLYSFTVPANKAYIVTETDPSGYVSITNNTQAVSVATGGAAIANFADIAEWTISGIVFEDINGNNALDEFELGLENITVTLSNGQSMTTSANGTYQFIGVDAGSYNVTITVPTSFASLTSTSYTVIVPAGGAGKANFPLVQTGSVLGVVFNDLNGNGSKDIGENGLSGILIELDGEYIHSKSDGSYEFINVPVGNYTVNSTTPNDFAITTDDSFAVTLTGNNSVSADFGLRLNGTISGVVFNDLNDNGIQDNGEPGMANVAIKLDGDNDTTTSANGSFNYRFLEANSKTITATPPTGYVQSTSLPLSVSVTPTGSVAFGFKVAGAISGQVINDLNSNSMQDDGEMGIAGIVVTLSGSNIDDIQVTTAFNGDYLFTGITTGYYTLTSVDAAEYISINSNNNSFDFMDVDTYSYNFFDRLSTAPFANMQRLVTDENTPLSIILSGSDSDGEIVSYQMHTGVSHGLISGVAPNFTYTPNIGFYGDDRFSFTVTDNNAQVSEAVSVLITVNPDEVIDTDGDGVPDYTEDQQGSDADDSNSVLDSDGDGVPDYIEGQQGSDADDANSVLDSDGDGVPDYTENQQGNDADDANSVLDSDGDGVPDYIEGQQGSDADDANSVLDSDGDGVPDYTEEQQGRDADDANSVLDSDGDGVPDYIEGQQGSDTDDANSVLDSDGDGVPDYIEGQQGSDAADTNSVLDSDGDGVPDYIEGQQGSDADDANSVLDTDNDGVGDYVEILTGSDPEDAESVPTLDTDGDNVFDQVELLQGTDPNDADSYLDTDLDGVPNFKESVRGTDSTDASDALQAIDDTYEFFSTEMVMLNVLDNDSGPISGDIEIISAYSSHGQVDIIDGELALALDTGSSGSYSITYIIKDNSGNTATANAIITVTSDLAPIITLPDDLCGEFTVNANALFTRINLGDVSAVDRFGNALTVSLVSSESLYKPGINEVFWQSTDSEGNTHIAKQLVCVMPLISIEKDKTVLEGESSTISIYLNGESPIYPVIIPFDVMGGEGDITLASGDAIIESGTHTKISFDVVADDLAEGDEKIDVSIASTVNRGDKYSHTLTITEGNVAPAINLVVNQANEERLTVSPTSGNVIITASVYDPNSDDSHTFVWSSIDELIENISENENQFVFDPSDLSEGVYTFNLVVNDSAIPQMEDVETVYINVVSTLAVLGGEDSDGDFIPDNIEGYADADGDGIPDYIDKIDECNVLQEQATIHDSYLIEGELGVCLRRGSFTYNDQAGGAQIIEDDSNISGTLPADPDAINIGGIFDYIAYGLPDLGQSFAIVMPQRKPVPDDAVYRKYKKDSGWGFFIEDINNTLWSTQGEVGYCPPPNTSGNNSIWTQGLTAGHWCVQQIIEDGGVNDDDDEVNGTIVDPGGVGVIITSNNLPVAVDDAVNVVINSEKSIDVLVNDEDEDGDLLVITSATANLGTVSIVDGQLYYVSANNYNGDIVINYGISDNNGGTDHAVVTVDMIENQAPLITDESSQVSQGGSISLNLLDNDIDPEEETLNLVAIDNANVNAQVSFSDDGQTTFTPAESFYGEVVIIYTVKDSAGNTADGQWVISVTEAVKGDALTTKSGGVLFWSLLLLMGCLVIRAKDELR